MAHNRKFVFGVVNSTVLRLRNLKLIVVTGKEIESLIIDSHFLDGAPFKWIGLMYRQVLKTNLKPKFGRICKGDGELPIAIELDSNILKWADNNNLELFKDIYVIGALEALIAVGKKYNLSTKIIEEERARYSEIPKTVEECEVWEKLDV